MADGYTNWLWNLALRTLPNSFSYSAPWIGLSTTIFSLAALFLRKRRSEDSLILFLFKCQYIVVFLYTLNVICNDSRFTIPLFNYNPAVHVPDIFCRIQIVLNRFIYCAAPWMQVVKNYIIHFW